MIVPFAVKWWAKATLLLACAIPATAALANPAAPGDDSPPKPVGRWRDASLEDYRQHLVSLQALTQTCAKARNVQACDPTLIGPDDRIPTSAASSPQRRIVRYGWLRILFSRAEEPDTATQAPASPKPRTADEPVPYTPPTTSKLLEDAQTRLAADLQQANAFPAIPAAHDDARATMQQVLAEREYRGLKQSTPRETALERFGNWLNRLFSNMDKLRARSAWVGRALIWGFFLAVAIALAWALIRMERRWRVRLVPMSDRPAPDAASARDWQLWLADARNAAAESLWREAIHFVYWAAISRLESKRLWPADRARTPREYLALVAPDDVRRDPLAALTRMFERTWYGGRDAAESDYRHAEAIARELISGGATVPAGGPVQPVAAQGSAG